MQALRQRFAKIRSSAQDPQDASEEVAREASADKTASRAKRRGRRKPSIANHRLFVPLIAIWGAALGALSVLVLPASSILQSAANVGLSGLGSKAGFVLAALAALVIGAIAAIAAIAYKRRFSAVGQSGPLAGFVTRHIQPIDPATDLGSDYLDAPLDTAATPAETEESDDTLSDDDLLVLGEDQICEAAEDIEASIETVAARGPTLGELSQRGYDADPADLQSANEDSAEPALRFTRRDYQAAMERTCEAIAETSPPKDTETKPRALDLAQFAETPGRNGVWVEEPDAGVAEDTAAETVDEAPETEPEPAAEERRAPTPLAARIAPSAPTALEKLRQAPVQELSLVHMVERFAAALHDHQDAEHKRPGSTQSPRSDAALAEALKALTLFTGDGFDADPQMSGKNADALRDTTRELRDALAKLQDLRGAA